MILEPKIRNRDSQLGHHFDSRDHNRSDAAVLLYPYYERRGEHAGRRHKPPNRWRWAISAEEIPERAYLDVCARASTQTVWIYMVDHCPDQTIQNNNSSALNLRLRCRHVMSAGSRHSHLTRTGGGKKPELHRSWDRASMFQS
jgi:hypothetical protein